MTEAELEQLLKQMYARRTAKQRAKELGWRGIVKDNQIIPFTDD